MLSYLSLWEFQKIYQYLAEYLKSKSYELKNDYEQFLPGNFIERIKKLRNNFEEKYKNEILQNVILSLNEDFLDNNSIKETYIYNEQLFKAVSDALQDNLPKDSFFKREYHERFLEILKNYNNDLSILLEQDQDNFISLVKIIGSILDDSKKYNKYYSYKDSQWYVLKPEKVGYIIKENNFSDISSMLEFIKKFLNETKFSMIKYVENVSLDHKQYKIFDNGNEKYSLVKIDAPEKGLLFEILVYLYIRAALNEVNIQFLCTHNLSIKYNNEITKEIDIPLLIKIFNKSIFLPIECKFTTSNIKRDDIKNIKIFKKHLDDSNLRSYPCIITLDSKDKIYIHRNKKLIIQLFMFKSWIEKLIKRELLMLKKEFK